VSVPREDDLWYDITVIFGTWPGDPDDEFEDMIGGLRKRKACYHAQAISVDALKHHSHVNVAVFPSRVFCEGTKKNNFPEVELTPNVIGKFSD
jgi:hypothetical protein